MANLNDLLDEQMGVQKLRPNVPLREQVTPSTEVPIHRNPMEVANGKAIFDAAKGNSATLNDIHNLSRVEIRQALINSGEDMGQITISSSKYAGSGAISREVAFNRLLAKGYSPEQIVKLAKGGN
jgi:stress-induced morphogen